MFQNQFLKSGVRFLYLTWSRTILELVMFHRQLPFCFVLFFFRGPCKSMQPISYFNLQVSTAKTKEWPFASLPLLIFLKYSRDRTGRGYSAISPTRSDSTGERTSGKGSSKHGAPLMPLQPAPAFSGMCSSMLCRPSFFWLRDRSFFLSAFYHFYSLVLAHRIGAIIISKGKLSFNTCSFKLEPIIFATKSGAESMSPGKTSHHFHYVIISLFPIQFRGEKKKPQIIPFSAFWVPCMYH